MKNLLGKSLLGLFLALSVFSLSACKQSADAEPAEVSQTSPVNLDVYKSETCGCCGLWVEHMNANNFESVIHHPEDLNAVKADLGIEPQWQSCHTAVSKEGFVFEGHIPAKFVQQFIDHPPTDALGLAVAGMPLGSPGMEVGERFTAYEILQINKDGSTSVYAEINSADDQF